MTLNENRIFRLTSSQAFRLMGGGSKTLDSKAITYIEEKVMEYRLGKSINSETYKFEMFWGQFMEQVLFKLLGIKWKIQSKKTDLHPKFGAFWSGSTDLLVPKVKVGEIKAFQYKQFCKLADCLKKKNVQLFKELFPEIYWQIVSNALIHKVWIGEIILYMPYVSELPEIVEMAEKLAEENPEDAFKYYEVSRRHDNNQLPCLPDGGYYSNITSFEFEIPEVDAQYCIDKFKLANSKVQEILKSA